MMIDLQDYFKKREIPLIKWEIEHGSHAYQISSQDVVRAIMKMNGEEYEVIANTIFSLDFRGAPLMDYMYQLAKDMVKSAHKN